jgi:hypothetical protein
MTIDPQIDDDVRDMLTDLAAPASPFGPAVVQAIHRKVTRQERLRRAAALSLASMVLLTGGAVAVSNGSLMSPVPPAGARHLVNWPVHGSGTYVLSRHLDADGAATATALTRTLTQIWDRSGAAGHSRVKVLYSDEIAGARGQIVVVAEGLSGQGQARLAVFTGYLPEDRPAGIGSDSFRLTADVAASRPKPRAILVALNGLARPPAGAGDTWHSDQSAVITLTGPSAEPAEVRIDVPSAPPRRVALEPVSGYAEAALGAVAIPFDRAATVFSLVDQGDQGVHPFRLIGPDAVVPEAGWPTAVVLVADR